MRVAKYWRNKKLRYRLIRRSQKATGGESAPRVAQWDEPAHTSRHKIRQAEYAT